MPQIFLTLSNNIDIAPLDFKSFFPSLHALLEKVPNLNLKSCKSGVIQEAYSYIGAGEPNLSKLLLEIRWLDSEARRKVKSEIVSEIFELLDSTFSAPIIAQGLVYKPHVWIVDLGTLNQDYWIERC